MDCFKCVSIEGFEDYVNGCHGEYFQCNDREEKYLKQSELRILAYLKNNNCCHDCCDDVIKEAIYLNAYYLGEKGSQEKNTITLEAYDFLMMNGYIIA